MWFQIITYLVLGLGCLLQYWFALGSGLGCWLFAGSDSGCWLFVGSDSGCWLFVIALMCFDSNFNVIEMFDLTIGFELLYLVLNSVALSLNSWWSWNDVVEILMCFDSNFWFGIVQFALSCCTKLMSIALSLTSLLRFSWRWASVLRSYCCWYLSRPRGRLAFTQGSSPWLDRLSRF